MYGHFVQMLGKINRRLKNRKTDRFSLQCKIWNGRLLIYFGQGSTLRWISDNDEMITTTISAIRRLRGNIDTSLDHAKIDRPSQVKTFTD